MPRHGYSDAPAGKDRLGFDSYAKGIAHFLATCETPLTLSLEGDWGTGKTTAFNLIERELDKRPGNVNIRVHRFDTWQYSLVGEGENLTFLLLGDLVESLEKTMKPKDEAEGKRRRASNRALKKNLLSIMDFGLQWTPAAPFSGVADRLGGAVLDELVGPDEADETSQKPSLTQWVRELEEKMSEAIAGMLAEGGYDRLVIFIDDLDRLRPQDAVSLLEGIKNFANWESCVFVLAVDREVVDQGIRAKFGNDIGPERQRCFFDKIIQLPFEMPVTQYDIEGYVEDLLPQELRGQADAYTSSVRSIARTNNPRAIKRAFNLWTLYQSIDGDGPAGTKDGLYLFAVLLFRLVTEKSEDPIERKAFGTLCRTVRPTGTVVPGQDPDDSAMQMASRLCQLHYDQGNHVYNSLWDALSLPTHDVASGETPADDEVRELCAFADVVRKVSETFVTERDSKADDGESSVHPPAPKDPLFSDLCARLRSSLFERPVSNAAIDYCSSQEDGNKLCSLRPQHGWTSLNIVFYFKPGSEPKERIRRAKAAISNAPNRQTLRLLSSRTYATLADITPGCDAALLYEVVGTLLDRPVSEEVTTS